MATDPVQALMEHAAKRTITALLAELGYVPHPEEQAHRLRGQARRRIGDEMLERVINRAVAGR